MCSVQVCKCAVVFSNWWFETPSHVCFNFSSQTARKRHQLLIAALRKEEIKFNIYCILPELANHMEERTVRCVSVGYTRGPAVKLATFRGKPLSFPPRRTNTHMNSQYCNYLLELVLCNQCDTHTPPRSNRKQQYLTHINHYIPKNDTRTTPLLTDNSFCVVMLSVYAQLIVFLCHNSVFYKYPDALQQKDCSGRKYTHTPSGRTTAQHTHKCVISWTHNLRFIHTSARTHTQTHTTHTHTFQLSIMFAHTNILTLTSQLGNNTQSTDATPWHHYTDIHVTNTQESSDVILLFRE